MRLRWRRELYPGGRALVSASIRATGGKSTGESQMQVQDGDGEKKSGLTLGKDFSNGACLVTGQQRSTAQHRPHNGW